MYIIKTATELDAYRLGDNTPMERQLLEAGKLEKLPDGSYLVFSRETDTQGQAARPGDYIKVDSAGFPYPNSREYFESRHTHLGGTRYRQQASPLKAWTVSEPLCPEIKFLISNGFLCLDETDEAHYFRAFLWNTELFAAKDAVVVFDKIVCDDAGKVTHVDFHFLAWAEFLVTHRIIE